MKIHVEEIKDTDKEATFVEEVREINEALAETGVVDYQFQGSVPVHVHYYRLGSDLFFRGDFNGTVTGTCARCLERYPFSIAKDFTFVLKPADELPSDQELGEEDLALSFYQGDEVDLEPLVREAMMLSLPTRPLCKEDCQGLCSKCGANRNLRVCDCRDEWIDPRFEVLRTLKPTSR